MTEPIKPRKLTLKQKKYVREYVKTGEKTAAYKAAYDVKTTNQASIQRMAVETSSLPHVKLAIEKAFIKHDIGIDDAVAPIAKAMKAKLAVTIDGERVETKYDDLEMQLKGSDRYLKLVGAHNQEDKGGNTFVINNANFNTKKYTD